MKSKIAFRFFCFIVSVGILFPFLNFAQEQTTVSKEEKKALIEKASKLLNENYVFPNVARTIEKHLKSQLAKGSFNSISSQQEFAEKLTAEMQNVSKDKHMRCFYRSGRVNSPRTNNVPNVESDYKNLLNSKHFGFIRAGMLENNIGVLDIYNFPGSDYAKESVDEAMKIVSSSSAIRMVNFCGIFFNSSSFEI